MNSGEEKVALNLMYITNNPEVAQIAEKAGVNRIFIDMEYIGKELRQKGMDTVQSHHTIQDILNVRKVIKKSDVLVRCNPIHNATKEYDDSEKEINSIIDSGADWIMLPYFKKKKEVESFLNIVHGRTKTMLLFETPEAVECIDEILELDGIDEAFIGLNDLSIGYQKKFMFELLADGTVEKLALKFRMNKIPFGFGGIARVGKGTLPAEKIIKEHYRLFSQSVILSRSFCNTSMIRELNEIDKVFSKGISEIRFVEEECKEHRDFFKNNINDIENIIKTIKTGEA